MSGFIKGLGWAILVSALLLGDQIGTVFAGRAIGGISVEWIAPLARGALAIAGMALAVWIIRVKINRESWTGMMLPIPQLGRLVLGALAGLSIILAIAGVEYELGWMHIVKVSHEAHWGVSRTTFILLELAPALSTGFTEEIAFRGYVFQTFGERAPVWVAALTTGVVFGCIHFTLPGFGVAFVATVALISTMEVILRFVTGSLWFPIGLHAMWDWTQTYLVGLAQAGDKHDPSLVQVAVTGPSLWIGGGEVNEEGLLWVIATVIVIVLALVYGAATKSNPPWTRMLSEDGKAIA